MTWDFQPKLVVPNGEHWSNWELFPVPNGKWGQLAPSTISSSDLPATIYFEMRVPFSAWLVWEITKTGTGSLPILIQIMVNK